MEITRFNRRRELGYSCNECGKSAHGRDAKLKDRDLHVMRFAGSKSLVCTGCLVTFSGHVNRRLSQAGHERNRAEFGDSWGNSIREVAQQLALRTEDAHSAPFYRSWLGVAKMLLENGYTEQEAEAIMRSKWTRWARDEYQKGSKMETRYLAEWLDEHVGKPGYSVADLMQS